MIRTTSVLALALVLAPLLLVACSASHGAGGDPPTPDASVLPDAGARGDAGGAVLCGSTTCPTGEVCCNASCGICAPPGAGCIAIACEDAGAPPDAGPAVCGTIAGLVCGPDQYCEYGGDPTCGGDDGDGTCLPRPSGCPDIYMPVCGCDRLTYSNACDAHAAGVGVSFPGPCEMPPPPADCRTTGCPTDSSCQPCWATWACLPPGAVC